MLLTRRATKPVPVEPRHRRRTWWSRWCRCGLRWPCPDRRMPNAGRWL